LFFVLIETPEPFGTEFATEKEGGFPMQTARIDRGLKQTVLNGSPLLWGFLSLCIVFSGCAASGNDVLKLQLDDAPYLYTDDTSRKLAIKTMQRLPEFYDNYRIGAEDVLEVSIFEWELREETKSVETRVSEDGLISLPVIGELTVKELTVEEVQGKIEKRLREWQIIPNPRVSVVVQQFRSKRVAVVGSVMDPGTYTLRRNATTLLDILSLAGGPDVRAGQVAYVILDIRPPQEGQESTSSNAEVIKEAESSMSSSQDIAAGTEATTQTGQAGQGQQPFGFMPIMPGRDVIAIDLYQLMELGDLSLNVLVGDGDIIYLPEAKRFYVIGFVRYNGSFSLKKPTTVLEGIAMAQGVREEEASVKKCALKRKSPEGEVIIPLNLSAIAKGKAPNIYLRPDDIVDVRQTGLRRAVLYTYNFITRVLNFGFTYRADTL